MVHTLSSEQLFGEHMSKTSFNLFECFWEMDSREQISLWEGDVLHDLTHLSASNASSSVI